VKDVQFQIPRLDGLGANTILLTDVKSVHVIKPMEGPARVQVTFGGCSDNALLWRSCTTFSQGTLYFEEQSGPYELTSVQFHADGTQEALFTENLIDD
jgi:hypothetical protein